MYDFGASRIFNYTYFSGVEPIFGARQLSQTKPSKFCDLLELAGDEFR